MDQRVSKGVIRPMESPGDRDHVNLRRMSSLLDPGARRGESGETRIFEIELDGEFDLAERHRLEDAFAIGETSPVVVVNLHKARYIDSSVLKCLVGLRKTTEERGAQLFLTGLRSGVRRIFEVTGLGQLFDIRNSLNDVPDADIAEVRQLTIEARPLP